MWRLRWTKIQLHRKRSHHRREKKKGNNLQVAPRSNCPSEAHPFVEIPSFSTSTQVSAVPRWLTLLTVDQRLHFQSPHLPRAAILCPWLQYPSTHSARSISFCAGSRGNRDEVHYATHARSRDVSAHRGHAWRPF